MIKVIIALLVVLTIFLFVYFYHNPYKKFRPLYVAVLFFGFSFSIALSHQTYRVVGEDLLPYVHFFTIIIFALWLMRVNLLLLKPSVDWLFFIPLGIQAIVSWDQGLITSSSDFLRVALNYLTVAMIVFIAESKPRFSIKTFLQMFNYIAVFNGVLSVAQIVTKKSLLIGNADASILYTEGLVDTFRAVGIAGSNNSAGNLACLLFVICLYNLGENFTWLGASGMVMSVVAALLAQTRIAFVAMAVAAFIWFITYKTHSRDTLLVKYIMGTIFVLLALTLLGLEFEKIIQVFFVDRGDTQNARFSQYLNAWDFGVRIHPFLGIGMGQWRSYLYNFANLVDIPIHSQYFSVMVECGVPVFIGFVIFNFDLLKKSLQSLAGNSRLRSFAVAFFAANFIVANFNPNQIYTVNVVIYYMVISFLAYHEDSLDEQTIISENPANIKYVD